MRTAPVARVVAATADLSRATMGQLAATARLPG
jgi:hypothetical protein